MFEVFIYPFCLLFPAPFWRFVPFLPVHTSSLCPFPSRSWLFCPVHVCSTCVLLSCPALCMYSKSTLRSRFCWTLVLSVCLFPCISSGVISCSERFLPRSVTTSRWPFGKQSTFYECIRGWAWFVYLICLNIFIFNWFLSQFGIWTHDPWSDDWPDFWISDFFCISRNNKEECSWRRGYSIFTGIRQSVTQSGAVWSNFKYMWKPSACSEVIFYKIQMLKPIFKALCDENCSPV